MSLFHFQIFSLINYLRETIKSNPNDLMWHTSATFIHRWLKMKGFYGFQMIEKLGSLNGYDHHNQVKTWVI